MFFERAMQKGDVIKVPPDILRAKGLLQASCDAIETALEIPMVEKKYKTILRELYEGLRQYCEAIGYSRGYKFSTHEVIVFFLDEILHEPEISSSFNKYRKLRNGINYYGKDISSDKVKYAKKEIPFLIQKLKKYVSF